jgi:hypothetical protein
MKNPMEQPGNNQEHYKKISELKVESRESAESRLEEIKVALADILTTFDGLKNDPNFIEHYDLDRVNEAYQCYNSFPQKEITESNFKTLTDNLEKIIPDAIESIGMGAHQADDLTFDFRGYLESHFGPIWNEINDTKKLLGYFLK